MHFDQAPASPDPKSQVTASVSSSEPRDHSQADHQWEEASQRLNAASLTGAEDTLINDILQSEDFVIDGASEAQGKFFNQALVITASDLTKRDVAFALAICIPDSGVANATASLLAEYNTSRLHAFLGPEMLHALSLLAERDAYARRETVGVLLQITPLETRYLLIRAAKIAGRLESVATTTLLRGKLEEWTESDDPAVSGEAFFQLALLSLGDALCAQDVASLTVRLADSRVAFARAEQSEECRVDARLYLALVDLLLSFHETDGTRDRHEIISARARQLIALIDNPRVRPWHGYASKAEELAQYRLLTIARCFEAISAAASEMEKWTNFDASLSEVAALYAMLLHGGSGRDFDTWRGHPEPRCRGSSGPAAGAVAGPGRNPAEARQGHWKFRNGERQK